MTRSGPVVSVSPASHERAAGRSVRARTDAAALSSAPGADRGEPGADHGSVDWKPTAQTVFGASLAGVVVVLVPSRLRRRMVDTGRSNQQIATALNVAVTTVRWYLKDVETKLGAANRGRASSITRRVGWLS